MPYLLPADPDVPERACILVFYPDAPEYRRALFGQIAELTDVWNWEGTREAQAIARTHWLDAERQTLECWSMACLDDILAVLEEIRDAPCCDTLDEVPGDGGDIVGVDDTTAPPDDVDIDSGVIPDGFTDVPDYQGYLCGAAHKFAESTDAAVDTISTIILVASNVLVFATLIVLAFGNIIGMGIAAILAGGYSLVTVSEIFGFFSLFTELREVLRGGDPGGTQAATKAELSAIYDDIVDAIYCSNSAGEATAALHALVDANVTSANYRGLLKLLWNGAFLAAIFRGFTNVADRFDCTCGFEFTFIADQPTWCTFVSTQNVGGSDAFCTSSSTGNQKMNPNAGGGFARFAQRVSGLATCHGQSLTGINNAWIQQVTVEYTVGSLGDFSPFVSILNADGSARVNFNLPGTPGFHSETIEPLQQTHFGTGGDNIRFEVPANGASNVSRQVCVSKFDTWILMTT